MGATPELFAALGKRHGYVMVHCESHGVNCFQVRADYLSTFDHENLPSSPRQRPLYGGFASNATCWPNSSKSTPWYELSPLDFSVISTDSQPARVAVCSSVGPLGQALQIARRSRQGRGCWRNRAAPLFFVLQACLLLQ